MIVTGTSCTRLPSDTTVSNLVHDVRWGRTMESYGEDPVATSKFVVAQTIASHGNDSKYLLTTQGFQHFVGYSLEASCNNARSAGVKTVNTSWHGCDQGE